MQRRINLKALLSVLLIVGIPQTAAALPLMSVVRTLRVQYVNAETLEPYRMPERPILYMDEAAGEIGAAGDANGNLIEVSFDEMSQDFKQYTYTVRHVNADGSEDNLTTMDYLQGFTTQDITDYAPSFNTQEVYTHYRFCFPNEYMRLTMSGRYEISVYEDGDRDKVVAQVPLFVAESRVQIEGEVLSTTDIELSGRYQQLALQVTTDGSSTDLRQDYFIVVEQNGRSDNLVYAPQPTFVSGKQMRWEHCRALIFEGGVEYRHFDAYSAYYAGSGIDRVTFGMGAYHVMLFTDEINAGKPYSHEYDVNGQFKVNAERVQDVETESEYMWVHWRLLSPMPMANGDIYVGGDLFDNRMTLRNKMEYDADLQSYVLTAPVKQGAYDYQYWFVPKPTDRRMSQSRNPNPSPAVTLLPTEGSHWETRNEYRVFVFFKPFGARGQRLVGVWSNF